MLSTIITLIGGGLGGLLRFVPELLKLFQDKSDKTHEIALTTLQLQLEAQKSAAASTQQTAQLQSQEILANMAALQAAIEGQDRLTGISWIDGINKLVRPTVTYWWLLIFTAYKFLSIWVAFDSGLPLAELVKLIWQDQDAAIMSMILTFWFVDRSIRRGNGDLK